MTSFMKKFFPYIIILLTLVQFSAGSLVGQTPDPTDGPKIKFDKEIHDYGDVYMYGDGNCIFKYTNTGTEPLLLNNVKAGCGCTVPDWSREPLMPGETASIKVRYTTLNRPHKIYRSIVVTSNAVNKPSVILKLKGNVIEPPPDNVPEKNINKSDGSI